MKRKPEAGIPSQRSKKVKEKKEKKEREVKTKTTYAQIQDLCHQINFNAWEGLMKKARDMHVADQITKHLGKRCTCHLLSRLQTPPQEMLDQEIQDDVYMWPSTERNDTKLEEFVDPVSYDLLSDFLNIGESKYRYNTNTVQGFFDHHLDKTPMQRAPFPPKNPITVDDEKRKQLRNYLISQYGFFAPQLLRPVTIPAEAKRRHAPSGPTNEDILNQQAIEQAIASPLAPPSPQSPPTAIIRGTSMMPTVRRSPQGGLTLLWPATGTLTSIPSEIRDAIEEYKNLEIQVLPQGLPTELIEDAQEAREENEAKYNEFMQQDVATYINRLQDELKTEGKRRSPQDAMRDVARATNHLINQNRRGFVSGGHALTLPNISREVNLPVGIVDAALRAIVRGGQDRNITYPWYKKLVRRDIVLL